MGIKAKGVFWAVAGFLNRQSFGIAILACAAIAFAFPSAFTEWVDFNAKFLDENGDTKWVMPDRLHPNARGYAEIWLPAVLPHFKDICRSEAKAKQAEPVVASVLPAREANAAPHLRGKISESAKFENLHPRFAKAFEFMRRPDLVELPCGRYEIDGSNCWAMVSEAALKPFAEENKYEVHRAFIDIQSPISGSETIGIANPDPKVFDGFNTAKDYVLFEAKGEPWTLKPGEFAIFFPENGAHAPGLSSDGPRTIRKLVIKVRK